MMEPSGFRADYKLSDIDLKDQLSEQLSIDTIRLECAILELVAGEALRRTTFKLHLHSETG